MMKKFTIIVITLILLSLLSPISIVSADDPWYSDFTYRKMINITPQSGAGTYYTVNFSIGNVSGGNFNLSGHSIDFPADVRFTDNDGTTSLDYWIENESVDPITAWVNVTDNLSSGSPYIYCYYGKSGASSQSDGNATFQFFDDFDNVSIWERQGDVISNVTTCESNVIYDTNPQILTGESNVFKNWYRYGWSTNYIYYAESINGINWTQYGSNPINLGGTTASPFALKHNDTYYLFVKKISNQSQLRRYSSSDGMTNWTDDGVVLNSGASGQWDDNVLAECTVWVENTTDWKMLYEGKRSGSPWKIGLATSSDGLSWTKSGSNPVISETGSVCGPAYSRNGSNISEYNGYYYIWLQRSPTSSLPTDINRYRSTNLTTWERSPSGNTFPRVGSDEGAGTSVGQVADPAMWEHNGQVYMWYSASSNGGSASGNMHIKLAIADMTFAELVETDENYEGDSLPLWENNKDGASVSNSILTYSKNMAGMNSITNFDDPCILRSRTKFTSISSYVCGHGFVDRSAVRYCWFNIKDGDHKFGVYDGSWTSIITNPTIDEFHTYEIHWESSSTSIFKDDIEMTNSPITSNIPTDSLPIEIYTQTGAEISHDWILVRKYNSPEPAFASAGEEESESPTDTTFTVTLPVGQTYAKFEPSNSTHKNCTPNGQTSSIPFYNVTNTGSVVIDVRMKLNTTTTNIDLKVDTDNNSAGSTTITTSLQTIYSNLAVDSNVDIWLWSDFDHAVQQDTNKTLTINVTQ